MARKSAEEEAREHERVAAFLEARERELAAKVGADLAEDRAALIAGFFEGRANRYSDWHDHPVVGPVLERAESRYGELRGFDFRFASRIAAREAVRELLAVALPQAEG